MGSASTSSMRTGGQVRALVATGGSCKGYGTACEYVGGLQHLMGLSKMGSLQQLREQLSFRLEEGKGQVRLRGAGADIGSGCRPLLVTC
jgi:hypothetical protein